MSRHAYPGLGGRYLVPEENNVLKCLGSIGGERGRVEQHMRHVELGRGREGAQSSSMVFSMVLAFTSLVPRSSMACSIRPSRRNKWLGPALARNAREAEQNHMGHWRTLALQPVQGIGCASSRVYSSMQLAPSQRQTTLLGGAEAFE